METFVATANQIAVLMCVTFPWVRIIQQNTVTPTYITKDPTGSARRLGRWLTGISVFAWKKYNIGSKFFVNLALTLTPKLFYS